MDTLARVSALRTIARLEGEGSSVAQAAQELIDQICSFTGMDPKAEHSKPPRTKRRRMRAWQKKEYIAVSMLWLLRWRFRLSVPDQPKPPKHRYRRTKFFGSGFAWVADLNGDRHDAYDMNLALESGKFEFAKAYWKNNATERQVVRSMIQVRDMEPKLAKHYCVEHDKMAKRVWHELMGGPVNARFGGSSTTVPDHEKTRLAFRHDVNILLSVKFGEQGGVPYREWVNRVVAADPQTEGEVVSGWWWEWR